MKMWKAALLGAIAGALHGAACGHQLWAQQPKERDMLKIRIVTQGRTFDGEKLLPPPCTCPDPNCRHCGNGLPYCPLLIDYPSPGK